MHFHGLAGVAVALHSARIAIAARVLAGRLAGAHDLGRWRSARDAPARGVAVAVDAAARGRSAVDHAAGARARAGDVTRDTWRALHAELARDDAGTCEHAGAAVAGAAGRTRGDARGMRRVVGRSVVRVGVVSALVAASSAAVRSSPPSALVMPSFNVARLGEEMHPSHARQPTSAAIPVPTRVSREEDATMVSVFHGPGGCALRRIAAVSESTGEQEQEPDLGTTSARSAPRRPTGYLRGESEHEQEQEQECSNYVVPRS